MFISEPFIRFESPTVAPISVPTGLPSAAASAAAVLAIALVLFVAMLAMTPGMTLTCPAPRAGTPVHLGR